VLEEFTVAVESVASCVFDTDAEPHLSQPLALYFEESELPSRHWVTPSIQSTPPCREQQPLQSASADIAVNAIDNGMAMNILVF
jgi:hypothetical protein